LPANAKPRTELVKRARAERILSMRAAGATQEQVARALDCSVETIRRTERWAEENGLLEEAQNRFTKMLNKAARVYEARLDDDKNNPKLALDAARDVAFGTGVLKKNHDSGNSAVVEEESLTLILKRRRERLQTADEGGTAGIRDARPASGTPAEDASDVIEGVVESRFGAAADGEDIFGDA
jgi:hypothetical protein